MSLSTEFQRHLSRTLKLFEKGQFGQVDLEQHDFEGRIELQIIKSLTNIQGYFQNTTNSVLAASEGDFEQAFRPRGKEDRLGHAVKQLLGGLKGVVRQANIIAKGDYTAEVSPRSDKDELGIALLAMTKMLQGVALAAEAVADGNLDIEMESRGPDDLLAKSMNRMTATLKDAARQANIIAKGDYTAEISLRSDKDELGIALLAMTKTLRAAQDEGLARDWIRDSIATLNNEMRGEKDDSRLGQDIVTCLAEIIGARVGAIFFTDEKHHLEISGRYAYEKREGVPDRFAFGEGLVGQAAVDGKIARITDVPEDYITVSSSLGRTPPRNIVLLPFQFENQVKGVIELGKLDEISDLHMELLNQTAESIAIAVAVSQARARQQQLLEGSQQLSEELQAHQEGLKVANEELEEQTQRLEGSEQRLKQQQGELQAANKELEAFAYSVSHDLLAPLRGIDGFSQALLEDYGDQLDETGRDYLNRVRTAVQRMAGLIDDLLKLSRLTRAEMHHQTLDLGELAGKIAAELQKGEPERQVDFDIAIGISARGDRALLETALENLLRNAWKFTGRRAQARIELGVTQQNGERVYYVRDDGAGFDMAYAGKLFGAFQRLHDAAEFPGNGIGLAIVNRVILRHGGRIWAEAERDKGATFYFTLPTVASASDEDQLESEK